MDSPPVFAQRAPGEAPVRVLVLTSSTGGGHDMRARSFAAWAREPGTPPLEVEIFQTLESGTALYRFGVGLYNWIQRVSPALHHLYFNALEVLALHEHASALQGTEAFVEKIQTYQPHVLVSTHAHLNHGYFALARRVMKGQVSCVTYCGELFGGYGFSRFWASPRVDRFLGAVPETCDAAARLGVSKERIQLGGFLLNPRFWDEPGCTQSLFDELRLDPDRFTLVLATGANSANNHLRLLEALARSAFAPQVIALCGRSDAALKAVQQWARGHERLSVRALAYFDRMPELLRVADAIVARPGTGTTSEAILCQCPILFNGIGGIMPQERITVEFARAHGFGQVLRTPRQLTGLLKPLMEDPSRLLSERAAMRSAQPNAHPLELLREVHALGATVLVSRKQ
ncbi:MAG: glycosyltransferase [Opitutales bacterium]